MSLITLLLQASLGWVVTTIIYRRYFHPLARVPGPFLPATTRLYIWYHNGVREGQFYKKLEQLHGRLGDKFIKDPKFYGGMGSNSMFFTSSKELHRQRRAPLTPFFSRKAVMEQELVVQAKIDKLLVRMQEALDEGKSFDLHAGLRGLSVDVTTQYAFDDCWNQLDREDLGAWWSETVRGATRTFHHAQQWPLLMTLLRWLPKWLARRMSPPVGQLLDTRKRVQSRVEKIQEQTNAVIQPKSRTIFHELLEPSDTDQKSPPNVRQLTDEAVNLLIASSDTVGLALEMAVYYVLENPRVYHNLVAELTKVFPDHTTTPDFTLLESLPYLKGVVNEGLRLSYGVISRLPRIVPSEGAIFDDFALPKGTCVSMSSWLMHRDPNVFLHADEFHPSRWTQGEPDDLRLRERYLVSFSKGSRGCLGINLAYCELYCTLGRLFRQFDDLEVHGVTEKDMQLVDIHSAWHPISAKALNVVKRASHPQKSVLNFIIVSERIPNSHSESLHSDDWSFLNATMDSSIKGSLVSSQNPPKRKLVTLRRISQLKPIKRSRWEVATVGGWNVVVAKGQHKIGEIVVYFEIDSFLPASNDRFWEYAISNASQEYEGQRGYVVRTIMRCDHISQGLIFPLNTFPEINVDKREELERNSNASPALVERAMMDLGYAELLGVIKFEQHFEDDDDSRVHGPSPIFFPQPGCDRAQNVVNLFQHYADKEFLVMQKLDGIPVTLYNVDTKSQWYNALPQDREGKLSPRPRYGLCGRFFDYVEEKDSLLWKTVRRQGIIEKLPRIAAHCASMGRKRGQGNFAVQREFCGEHILGNSMGFGSGQHHFYAFAIFDIDNQVWLPPQRTVEVCKNLAIDHAPVIARSKLGDFAKDVKELLHKAEGKGTRGNNREGLVFKALDNSFAFKVIVNNWSLEYGHHKITPDQW
ncbi:cytochrome P450 [Seiridium cupressi]